MLEVVGHRVLVKPKSLEKEHNVGNGVKLVISYGSDEKRHEAATMQGTVVGVGPAAWKDWGDGSPWAKIGDEIIYAQYAGKNVEDPETKERYVVINDEDVQVKVN